MRREHRVPLSDAAVRLLRALPRDGELIFGKLFHNGMIRLVWGLRQKTITVHGFRATFKSWSLDTDRPQDIVEMALAHLSGDKVAAAYTRTDLLKRRASLAEAWGAFCAPPAPAGDNVRAIRAAG
jgi:integrase